MQQRGLEVHDDRHVHGGCTQHRGLGAHGVLDGQDVDPPRRSDAMNLNQLPISALPQNVAWVFGRRSRRMNPLRRACAASVQSTWGNDNFEPLIVEAHER
jgi:hypothetical protein